MFSRGLCFGRAGGVALRALSETMAIRLPLVPCSPSLADSLRLLVRSLRVARPRQIPAVFAGPVVLMTDGSFERPLSLPPMGGIGGVLLDRRDGAYLYFRWRLPTPLCRVLADRAGGQPIFQLEVLPLLAAFCVWERRLKDCCSLSFVDNEGARSALVAGRSSHQVADQFVSEVGDRSAAAGSLLWYERVPSPANLADAPSRGMEPPDLEDWGAPRETELSALDRERFERILRG